MIGMIKTMIDKINDNKIVPGPMIEVAFLGMMREPRPRIRKPRKGNRGIKNIIIAMLFFSFYHFNLLSTFISIEWVVL